MSNILKKVKYNNRCAIAWMCVNEYNVLNYCTCYTICETAATYTFAAQGGSGLSTPGRPWTEKILYAVLGRKLLLIVGFKKVAWS